MDIILKAKHWQIFGALILISFFQAILRTADPIVSAISYIIMIVVNFGWILLLGVGLTKRLPNQNSRQFTMFLSAGIILIFVVCVLRLRMALGIIDLDTNTTTLTVVLVSYLILSLAIVCWYPAKTLKSLETNGEIDINDYFGDIFRLVFWPIGIWSIQPRINKITNDEEE